MLADLKWLWTVEKMWQTRSADAVTNSTLYAGIAHFTDVFSLLPIPCISSQATYHLRLICHGGKHG